MRLYLESASSAEGAAGIRNAIICDYIFSTLHLPQVPISLLLPTRPRPSPRQSGHLSAPPAPSSVPASLPLLLPPPPHSPGPRRRPDGAVTSVVTPRPTPLPPCLAFRAPEEGRPLGAATMDLWLGGLREEPGARAPPGSPGMDVPLRRLWLSGDGRSFWAGFALVVAFGAWEGASSVNSKLLRCKIFHGRPYSFIEFLPLSVEWFDRNVSRYLQNLPVLTGVESFPENISFEEAARCELRWQ